MVVASRPLKQSEFNSIFLLFYLINNSDMVGYYDTLRNS